MSLSTYSDLQTAVANLLNRTDLTNYIPDWITMAEAAFNRSLEAQNSVVTQTITVTGPTYPLPEGFSEVDAFWLDQNSGQPLEYVTLDQFDNISDYTGTPYYYTISGGYFYFAPPPSGSFTLRLRYTKNLTPLSDDNTTNWILQSHPDLYLYGTLIHSAPFLNDDQRLLVWEGKYASVLRDVNSYSRRQRQGSRLQTKSGIFDRGFITSGQATWR